MTMCNHSYTADHFGKHRFMGNRCPYPEFYEKARSTVSRAPEAAALLALPMDDQGACIFHSQEIAWKRKNDFEGKLLHLVQLLDADGAGRDYDFAEFVFVGSELRTKNGSEEHVLHIADTAFRKQAYFTVASFLD